MKKYLTYAIAVWFVTIIAATAAPDKAAIEANEKAAWQAFKDKNADAFKKLADKDLRAVYAEGILNLQQELDDMKNWDIKSFSFSEFNAFSDEPDVVVTTYKVTVEGTNNGEDMSGTYNAGSVWKKEKGAWLVIFHTNIMTDDVGADAATSPSATP
jgi:ketosteroid isomerase-like protein